MSQHAKEINHLFATLNEQGDKSDIPLPDEEELDTIHVYLVEGGGLLLTREPLEPGEAAPLVVDSQDDHINRAATKTPPLFVLFLLLLCVFVLGDLDRAPDSNRHHHHYARRAPHHAPEYCHPGQAVVSSHLDGVPHRSDHGTRSPGRPTRNRDPHLV